jgi:hypothetical protein
MWRWCSRGCIAYIPGNGPLQAKYAQCAVCRHVLGTQFEQEQIGHDRYGHGAFDTAALLGDLMVAQASAHRGECALATGYRPRPPSRSCTRARNQRLP